MIISIEEWHRIDNIIREGIVENFRPTVDVLDWKKLLVLESCHIGVDFLI